VIEMKRKVVIGGLIVLLGVIWGAINFLDSNVEYGDFADARRTHKKIQVKGEWVKDRESSFNSERMQFVFYLKDDSGEIAKVVLEGAKPNNFDLATNIVVKGKYTGDYFHATEVLTKCPSKYEGKTGPMKKKV
jgi:cytochrome c-type biogenesis protein CcmE